MRVVSDLRAPNGERKQKETAAKHNGWGIVRHGVDNNVFNGEEKHVPMHV